MAQFRPGQSGNPSGRPRGAKGKTSEVIRDNIRKFLAKNLSKMQKDFDKLDPKERIMLLERLMRHVLPAPQDELAKLSDEDLDKIIEKLKNDRLKVV